MLLTFYIRWTQSNAGLANRTQLKACVGIQVDTEQPNIELVGVVVSYDGPLIISSTSRHAYYVTQPTDESASLGRGKLLEDQDFLLVSRDIREDGGFGTRIDSAILLEDSRGWSGDSLFEDVEGNQIVVVMKQGDSRNRRYSIYAVPLSQTKPGSSRVSIEPVVIDRKPGLPHGVMRGVIRSVNHDSCFVGAGEFVSAYALQKSYGSPVFSSFVWCRLGQGEILEEYWNGAMNIPSDLLGKRGNSLELWSSYVNDQGMPSLVFATEGRLGYWNNVSESSIVWTLSSSGSGSERRLDSSVYRGRTAHEKMRSILKNCELARSRRLMWREKTVNGELGDDWSVDTARVSDTSGTSFDSVYRLVKRHPEIGWIEVARTKNLLPGRMPWLAAREH